MARKTSFISSGAGPASFTEFFQQLGLSKNESRIYETLLRYGELSVGQIAVKSQVHRRNVYDSVQRLVERGLAFEIIARNESRFQAVDPNKLRELIHEKEQSLLTALPSLQALYKTSPDSQSVFIYRGIEGWKTYLRDILRLEEDFYCIGAKGAWMDKRLVNFFPSFIRETQKKKMNYFHIFDHEVRELGLDIVKHVGKNYRYLPKGYSAPASLDFFGDRVNIISNIHIGGVEDDMWFAVIVNRRIADAFRIWFKFMWDYCPKR